MDTTAQLVEASSQIAIFHCANVGILLAVLLDQYWQLTFARRHFAYRGDVVANGWFNVDLFHIMRWANVGLTWFNGTSYFNLLDKGNSSSFIPTTALILKVLWQYLSQAAAITYAVSVGTVSTAQCMYKWTKHLLTHAGFTRYIYTYRSMCNQRFY